MNIKITYNWLLEYLDTDAEPYEIQQYLSLCGPSVEKVEKKDDDYVLDIEITSNRIDSASVIGIAQECSAILPRFGKKAHFKYNPSQSKEDIQNLPSSNHKYTLDIKNNPQLCSRFTALVFSDISIKKSPDYIRQRLTLVDIKSINNVVDISNYLMIAFGQPVHMFDYDAIRDHTMIVRESVKGEHITTLDGKNNTLEEGDIVIEDGAGRLIDLCGIMGGLNSSITEKTKNVILFVQTYNKEKIRKTSMRLAIRTTAATYFEKGLDEERVYPTLTYGTKLLMQHAQAQPAGKIYDMYLQPYKTKIIDITSRDIQKSLGIALEKKEICSILENLGFSVSKKEKTSDTIYTITIPSYRKNDVTIKEDIIEEIARIYGYFNFPSHIPQTDLPLADKKKEKVISYENKVKNILALWGMHEMYNYSMISEKQISLLNLDKEKHLKIKNTISSDIEYMRISLVPSLLKNIHENEACADECLFFELAHVYHKKPQGLPHEKSVLTLAVNSDFFDLKGIIESLLETLNINNIVFTPNSSIPFLSTKIQASIGEIGWIGKLNPLFQNAHKIKKPVYIAEFDFEKMIESAHHFTSYQPINPYAVITLDLTIEINQNIYAQEILHNIKAVTPLDESIHRTIKIVGIYKNKLTLGFSFSSRERNITLEEAKKELQRIHQRLKEK